MSMNITTPDSSTRNISGHFNASYMLYLSDLKEIFSCTLYKSSCTFRAYHTPPVAFRIKQKLVRFASAQQYCADKLLLRQDYYSIQEHCNVVRGKVEIWDTDILNADVNNFFQIIYSTTSNSIGGKFWLEVKGGY